MSTDAQRAKWRRYVKRHAAKRLEYNKRYRKSNPEKVKEWTSRAREKSFAKRSARQKRYVEERKAKGLCRFCGKDDHLPGLQYCSACQGKAAQRHAKKKSLGLCLGCPREAIVLPDGSRHSRCEICYFKHAAHTNLGDRTLWTILRDLLSSQGYRCPYTGDTLVIGVNASVDHKFPWSRFPELRHSPENLEWVSERVNAFKVDRTPEEFLDLVARIFRYRLADSGEVN